MRKLSQNLYTYFTLALILSSCGGLGTQAVLNPASGFQSPGLAPGNAATTAQNDNEDQESEETILMPDGSVVAFDENGNIVASDTPTATLNSNPNSPSSSWDAQAQSGDDSFGESYAYAPQDQQDYSETNTDSIPNVFDDFNDTPNDSQNPENSNPNNPSSNNPNSVDVTDQENFENSVELNDPLDELAHLPVTVAKNNNLPPFDPTDPDPTDPGDEEEDCGEGETTQIDIGGEDNEGNNEFEDPNGFGGPGSDPDSNSNGQNTMTVGVTDCGDEEEGDGQVLDEESDSNYFADRDMELVIIQTEQNPTTGKWELADDYVIVAAENIHQNAGKVRFKVDTSLLNNSNSGTKKAPRLKTHLILNRGGY